MKDKSYRSFAEIDRDLQIAKLERDIHREKVFLKVEKVKNSLSPSSLLRDSINLGKKSSLSSSLIMNAVNFVLPFVIRKIKK